MIDAETSLLRAVMTRDFTGIRAADPVFRAAKERLIEKGLLRQPNGGTVELNISDRYLRAFRYEKRS